MFATIENIKKHYIKILSVDLGYEAESKVKTAQALTLKALENNYFDISYEESKIVLGFKIISGLDAEDFYCLYCLDLHSLQLSDYGKECFIDYLAETVKDYFYYAVGIKGWK